METVPGAAGDLLEQEIREAAALLRILPSGFGTVHVLGGTRVGGYIRMTDNLVICWLRKPDHDGNSCRIWPWARVAGVDLVEDE